MAASVEELPGAIMASPKVRQRACFSQLMGVWSVETTSFRTLWELAQSVGIPRLKSHGVEKAEAPAGQPQPEPLQVGDGVAIIGIGGPMTKEEHSFQALFGGTSTTRVREDLARALADPAIDAVVLHIDSPGGTIAGSVDLADDVARARASGSKPIVAYYEDMAASAALWLGSQAEAVYANRSAIIGSIGVYEVIYDDSQAYENAGVKAIVVSTGGVKGIGAEGVKITKEAVENVQRRIDDIGALFIDAVARGRRMNAAAVKKLATGETWVGKRAVDLGLVDAIGSFEMAVADARARGKRRKSAYTTVLASHASSSLPDTAAASNAAPMLTVTVRNDGANSTVAADSWTYGRAPPLDAQVGTPPPPAQAPPVPPAEPAAPPAVRAESAPLNTGASPAPSGDDMAEEKVAELAKMVEAQGSKIESLAGTVKSFIEAQTAAQNALRSAALDQRRAKLVADHPQLVTAEEAATLDEKALAFAEAKLAKATQRPVGLRRAGPAPAAPPAATPTVPGVKLLTPEEEEAELKAWQTQMAQMGRVRGGA